VLRDLPSYATRAILLDYLFELAAVPTMGAVMERVRLMFSPRWSWR